MAISIGGNLTAGGAANVAEGNITVTTDSLPAVNEKVLTVQRELAKAAPDQARLQQLFAEIYQAAPKIAKLTYLTLKDPLNAIGVFLDHLLP
jgi:hypothetical protein